MNPDNYGTPEACKKLAEVLAKKGIVLETEFCWFPDVNSLTGWSLNRCFGKLPSPDCIPAYSMPEVWRELPTFSGIVKGVERSIAKIAFDPEPVIGPTRRELESIRKSANPADALIELWIWVLEQEEP